MSNSYASWYGLPRYNPQTPMSRWLVMLKSLRQSSVVLCLAGLLPGLASAQASRKTPASNATSSAQSGIGLAEKGHCSQALPVLQKAMLHLADKQLKYHAAMATARCAMSLNQEETAVAAILLLRREFPHDLAVLYFTTHYFSELASRASQELAATAPASPQARELDAEAFESQGKWDEAVAEYNLILKESPQEPGIHYRLGRILLAKPATATTNAEAQKELEEEIKIDPSNASAEFMLGEIARQAGQWDAAIPHFVRACKLDEGFLEAYLALGISLNSAGRFPDAIAPLEKYVKTLPSDPAGHYQLATAYSRTGHKEQAAREMVLQREAADQSKNVSPERTAPH